MCELILTQQPPRAELGKKPKPALSRVTEPVVRLNTDSYALIQGYLDEVDRLIAPESIDCIIMSKDFSSWDTPSHEYLVRLAQFATRSLKIGGDLFVSTESFNLGAVCSAFGACLDMVEVVCCWQKIPHGIDWTPVAWYHKGLIDSEDSTNVLNCPSEEWMIEVIRRFTHPGDLVCDPICADGRPGAMAVEVGRRFVAITNHPHSVLSVADHLTHAAECQIQVPTTDQALAKGSNSPQERSDHELGRDQ